MNKYPKGSTTADIDKLNEAFELLNFGGVVGGGTSLDFTKDFRVFLVRHAGKKSVGNEGKTVSENSPADNVFFS